MSQVHVSWTYLLLCGRISSGASKEAQNQIGKNVIQNFDLSTTSAFKVKKGQSCGNKYGISKIAQDHGKANDALKAATKRGNSTILKGKTIMGKTAGK